jgi:hypothetical protein
MNGVVADIYTDEGGKKSNKGKEDEINRDMKSPGKQRNVQPNESAQVENGFEIHETICLDGNIVPDKIFLHALLERAVEVLFGRVYKPDFCCRHILLKGVAAGR